MYYDNDKIEAAKALAVVAENGGDTNTVLLGGIVSALYDIANELHEANTIMLKSTITHMTLDNNGATIHYGFEKGVRPGDK